MHHPHVVQSPMFNDYLEVKIDGHTEPQMVPNILLQFSIRELHNNLVSDADNGGLKEAIDEDNNIIISNSTLRHYCHPNLKHVVKIQDHVWLQMLHICQNYTSVITVMAISSLIKNQGSQPKCSK